MKYQPITLRESDCTKPYLICSFFVSFESPDELQFLNTWVRYLQLRHSSIDELGLKDLEAKWVGQLSHANFTTTVSLEVYSFPAEWAYSPFKTRLVQLVFFSDSASVGTCWGFYYQKIQNSLSDLDFDYIFGASMIYGCSYARVDKLTRPYQIDKELGVNLKSLDGAPFHTIVTHSYVNKVPRVASEPAHTVSCLSLGSMPRRTKKGLCTTYLSISTEEVVDHFAAEWFLTSTSKLVEIELLLHKTFSQVIEFESNHRPALDRDIAELIILNKNILALSEKKIEPRAFSSMKEKLLNMMELYPLSISIANSIQIQLYNLKTLKSSHRNNMIITYLESAIMTEQKNALFYEKKLTLILASFRVTLDLANFQMNKIEEANDKRIEIAIAFVGIFLSFLQVLDPTIAGNIICHYFQECDTVYILSFRIIASMLFSLFLLMAYVLIKILYSYASFKEKSNRQ